MGETAPVVRSRQVTIPEAVWGKLASAAEMRGVTVEDVLVSAISSVTEPQSTRERVLAMVRAGLADATIADHVGLLLYQVAQIRRNAHLPANTFGRGGGGPRRT
jgi:hypothetical protein